MDHQNRIESTERNPDIYGQLIFDKGGKNTQQRKESLFSQRCYKSWTDACKSMSRIPPPTLHKNKLKMAQRLKYKT